MNHPQPESNTSLNHFLSLMNQYEGFVAQAGKRVRRASPEKTKSIFNDADLALKKRMIERLECEISIFEDTLGAGEALDNAARQLWRYLIKRRLVPCSDLFDKIEKTDTIQVFGTDLRIHFVSLNFFDCVSFTLEQIFSETWQTAVSRDNQFSQSLMGDFSRLFSGKICNTVKVDTPTHRVEEVETECLLESDIHVRWMSPVYLNEKIDCGVFVVVVDNLDA